MACGCSSYTPPGGGGGGGAGGAGGAGGSGGLGSGSDGGLFGNSFGLCRKCITFWVAVIIAILLLAVILRR